MKRYAALCLAALMLFSFTACRNNSAPAAEVTAEPTQEALVPSSTPEPVSLPQGETTSILAGTLQIDENGVIWTSLAPVEGMNYVYDYLPEDCGHVYSFLVHDGTLYTALKEHAFSMDFIRIVAFDMETGEQTTLAENVPANGTFCLLGEATLLYMEEDGFCTLDIPSGRRSEPLAGASTLLAARDGSFYYTRIDESGLFRNNSTLAAEETLLEECPSYWLCPGADSLCTLVYTQEGTAAAVEFRAADGTLRSRQPLNELPMGICSDGESVYVPQTGERSIRVYDMTTGELTGTIALPEGSEYCIPLLVQGETIYYQALKEGSFCLYRLGPEDTLPTELAADLLV